MAGMKPISEADKLAKQAMLEFDRDGFISVVCPKCHKNPEITMTSHGERTTVKCPCGYILYVDINF